MNAMPTGDNTAHRAGHQALRDDPRFLFPIPSTTALRPVQDLNATITLLSNWQIIGDTIHGNLP